MRSGKPIPVWYSQEDRRTVEDAAALAGYQHLSTYIRDRSLGGTGRQEAGRDSLDAWADRQELLGRLAVIERSQSEAQVLLSLLFFLLCKQLPPGEAQELILACEKSGVPSDVLASSMPALVAQLGRLMEAT